MTQTEFYKILENLDEMDYNSKYIPTIKDLLRNNVESNFDKYKEYLLYLSEKLAEKGVNLTSEERELKIYLNNLFSKHLTF